MNYQIDCYCGKGDRLKDWWDEMCFIYLQHNLQFRRYLYAQFLHKFHNNVQVDLHLSYNTFFFAGYNMHE